MIVRHSAGLVTFDVADDSALAVSIIRRDVETSVNELAAKYGQYLGYVDGWEPVRIIEPVRTKLGQAFEAGDLTLATDDRGDGFITCWSIRNQIATSVPEENVLRLAVTA